MRSRPASLAPLAERRFRVLFLSSSVSVMGDRFTLVALAFAVLAISHSVTALGLVLAAQTFSMVGFLLVGGVWADRAERRIVMLVADLVRAGGQAAMAILLLTGTARLWHLVLLQVLNGAATAFFNPAATGLVPETLSASQLQSGNALLSLSWSIGSIVGPPLAGLLVAVASPGWAVAADSASFLASAWFLLGLGPTGYVPPAAEAAERFRDSLAAGWAEVRSRTWLWPSICDMALYQFAVLGSFYVLGPVISARSFGGARAWGTIVGAFAVGSVVGGAMALRLRPRYLLRAVFLSSLLALPGLVLLGLRASFPVVVAGELVAGSGMAFAGTLWLVVLQQHIRPAAISRVSSFDWIGSTALRPLGLALAGVVANVIGIGATLLAAASLMVVATTAVLALPAVRRLERVPEDPAGTESIS